MSLFLPASGSNHGNNHRPFAEWKRNKLYLIVVRIVPPSNTLQNLMCIKIVEYKILEQALDKSI